MLSRPGRRSLRTTWVTPATLLLACLYTAASVAMAVLLLARGGWVWVLCAIVLLVAGSGSASVAAIGLAQRRRTG
ncbi:MAG: hypothetical protein M3019_10715 [Candidatus Dormibacteraeota bacterium]|nr:hypothetical protein [Candidatus Dormibacteraeota bacterium]